ncbi:MAG: hypothetical protein RMI94_15195 [Bryobacterales bacterium]|nr:hypothetical protein [Bryobacteraceae bacterium]MDW8131896.1 hypothetical protein [Bryobacterales bacterium]
MRRRPEEFADRELVLLYIAKRLSEARELEAVLTAAGLDYVVVADRYLGGVILRRERVGAFFYVLPESESAAREAMQRHGFRPFSDPFAPA